MFQSMNNAPTAARIVVVSGHEKELAAHVRRGTLHNGLTEEKVCEAMFHVMGYAGFLKGLEV